MLERWPCHAATLPNQVVRHFRECGVPRSCGSALRPEADLVTVGLGDVHVAGEARQRGMRSNDAPLTGLGRSRMFRVNMRIVPFWVGLRRHGGCLSETLLMLKLTA